MTYWVVRLDSDLPKLPGGARSEVRIQYPSESKEEAKKTADILNEGEVEKCARMSREYYHTAPGTTPVSYIVMSEEDLQQYHQIGTRVVR